MFYLNKNIMKKLSFFTILILVLSLSQSCKRKKEDYLGPKFSLASSSFTIVEDFTANDYSANFATNDTIRFHAKFNETVNWEIKISSPTGKAFKIIRGYSNEINSIWTGGHSGLYFFNMGETVRASLTVNGNTNSWNTPEDITIISEKINYGEDVIVWWDMDVNGKGAHGILNSTISLFGTVVTYTAYWFDFYDGDGVTSAYYANPVDTFVHHNSNSVPKYIGTSERIAPKIEVTQVTSNDPIQGVYRYMEGVDGLGSSGYYIGGAGHSPIGPPVGFDASTPLDQLYLNFYVRGRTNTSNMGIALTSRVSAGVTSTITYSTGQLIPSNGWKLVSVKFSDMVLNAGNQPFNPRWIQTIGLNPFILNTVNQDHSGFDIDMIVLTKGQPFNPDRY